MGFLPQHLPELLLYESLVVDLEQMRNNIVQALLRYTPLALIVLQRLYLEAAPELHDLLGWSFCLEKLNQLDYGFELDDTVHRELKLALFVLFLRIVEGVGSVGLSAPRPPHFLHIEVEQHLDCGVLGGQQDSIVQDNLGFVHALEIVHWLQLELIQIPIVEHIVDIDSLVFIVDDVCFVDQHELACF